MKQTMKYLSMVALVVMGAIVISCAKEEPAQLEETPEVVEPVAEDNIVVCTTTVSFDTDATKALDADGVKTFASGEKIAVIYKNTSNQTVKAESGALPAGDYGHSATFTVTLTNPMSGGDVRIIYPAAMAASTVTTSVAVDADATINYATLNTQDGTLATLSSNLDLAVYDGALNGTSLPTDPALKNKLAICEYTLKNSDGSNNITSSITGMTISDGTYNYSVSRSAAAGPIYVAIRPTASANISFTATDGSNYYVKEVTEKTYEASKMYPLGLRMATSNTINLAKLSANYTVQDGQTITGTLGANVKISIADGATVTLNGVTINGTNDSNYPWAGITCLGDATIILSGTNTLKGFDDDYPGIQAAHNTGAGDEYTLTIQGTGSLNASSNGNGDGIGGWECGNITINSGTITATGGSHSAGIGGVTCGKITITGGTVTATGGQYGAGIGCSKDGNCTAGIEISGTANVTAQGGDNAAGIGSGHGNFGSDSTCGNITISGTATVSATGGNNGAGIGAGDGLVNYPYWRSQCGDITISNTVTCVTATKGAGAACSIGRGGDNYSYCGTVTIGGKTGAITTSPYIYPEPVPTGAINGRFSVSSTKQVWFSQGNLQAYNATANSTSGWVWSFATNQWDYIGSSGSNQYINGSMTISTAGYVDLFNWVGASASNDNYGIVYDQAEARQGTNFGTSTTETLKHDWGHNPIANGGNVADIWRTPTNDEWVYLINSRTTAAGTAPTINGTADARYAKAKLFGTNRGLIIFPDTYVHPAGVAYPTGINAEGNTSWDGNQYTAADWAKMESAGCVFLPCTGIRVYNTQVNDKETRGFYASSTPHPDNSGQAKVMHFTETSCVPNSNRFRRDAGPVRLVKDAN